MNDPILRMDTGHIDNSTPISLHQSLLAIHFNPQSLAAEGSTFHFDTAFYHVSIVNYRLSMENTMPMNTNSLSILSWLTAAVIRSIDSR